MYDSGSENIAASSNNVNKTPGFNTPFKLIAPWASTALLPLFFASLVLDASLPLSSDVCHTKVFFPDSRARS